jgi:isochorismate synthase
MSLFQDLAELLRSGSPFAVCRFPASGVSGDSEVFRWTGSELLSDNGSVWVSEPFSPEAQAKNEIPSRQNYLDWVLMAKSAIRDGRLEKVVLSRIHLEERMTSDYNELPELYLKLLALYPSALVYIMRHHQYGLWMGATPEVLVAVEDGVLQTMALAGTRRISAGEATQPWTEKEYHEHRLVALYLTGILNDYGVPEIGAMQTIQAGPVYHLMTPLTVRTGVDVREIALQLHPTPAVCGWSSDQARRFILETESFSRELFTGYLGAIRSNGNANLFVNLRCMKITPSVYRLFAGAGITAGSNPEDEWDETSLKIDTLLRAIRSGV